MPFKFGQIKIDKKENLKGKKSKKNTELEESSDKEFKV